MKFWCYEFEGLFTKDSTEYPNEPFFSSCLVQSDNYNDAEFKFIKALTERKINLIEIGESFLVDTGDLDLEDENSLFWIEWCEETELAGKPIFDTFSLYPLEELDIKTANEN